MLAPGAPEGRRAGDDAKGRLDAVHGACVTGQIDPLLQPE